MIPKEKCAFEVIGFIEIKFELGFIGYTWTLFYGYLVVKVKVFAIIRKAWTNFEANVEFDANRVKAFFDL